MKLKRSDLILIVGLITIFIGIYNILNQTRFTRFVCVENDCLLSKWNFIKGNQTINRFKEFEITKANIVNSTIKIRRKIFHKSILTLKTSKNERRKKDYVLIDWHQTTNQISHLQSMIDAQDSINEYKKKKINYLEIQDSNLYSAIMGGISICIFGVMILFISFFVQSNPRKEEKKER